MKFDLLMLVELTKNNVKVMVRDITSPTSLSLSIKVLCKLAVFFLNPRQSFWKNHIDNNISWSEWGCFICQQIFFCFFFFFISWSRRFVRFHTKLVDILTIVIWNETYNITVIILFNEEVWIVDGQCILSLKRHFWFSKFAMW